MTLVFFGSSEFSISALKACLDSPHKVTQIISTPDQKKGRGLKEAPTPVKIFAQEKGIPVDTPPNLKSAEALEKLKKLKPDFFVVSSYGKIIPKTWLAIPSQICLNVHPSLLPKYRGAGPIQWPLLNGDYETGLSIAEVTDKLDAGDIFYQHRMPLEEDDNAVTLTQKLAELSYHSLLKVFSKIEDGKLGRIPQDEAASSYARKLEKEDGLIRWERPAVELHNQVRGLLAWPVAFTSFEKQPVQILKTKVLDSSTKGSKPGAVTSLEKTGVGVQTGQGILILETVKPSGKKEMSGAEFARGRRISKGSAFDGSH